MSNSGPGYKSHPEHRVELKRGPARLEVTVGGETIADTANAIAVHEDGHPVVYYVPRSDVKMDRLARTTHHTSCPFKGEASYFSLIPNGAENAVWTYEAPYDEVLPIKDHLAFYPNKVDAITAT